MFDTLKIVITYTFFFPIRLPTLIKLFFNCTSNLLDFWWALSKAVNWKKTFLGEFFLPRMSTRFTFIFKNSFYIQTDFGGGSGPLALALSVDFNTKKRASEFHRYLRPIAWTEMNHELQVWIWNLCLFSLNTGSIKPDCAFPIQAYANLKNVNKPGPASDQCRTNWFYLICGIILPDISNNTRCLFWNYFLEL